MILKVNNVRIKHLINLLLIAVLCAITFRGSLSNGFIVDDYSVVLNDVKLHNLRYFFDYFLPFRVVGGDAQPFQYYRPFAHLVPMLAYQLCGVDPFKYHVFNLIFFYGLAVSLYGFINFLLRDQKTALLTVLFFCLHPINGLMVNYITAHVFILQIIFILLSMFLYLIAMEKRPAVLFHALSAVMYLFAIMCHETSIVLPLYLAAILFFYKRIDLRSTFFRMLPMSCIAVYYFILRLKFASLKTGLLDKVVVFDVSFFVYLASLAKLIGWYLWQLMAFPGIVLIWATSPERSHILGWIVSLAGLISALSYGMAYYKKKCPEKALALSWFCIGLTPVALGCFFQPSAGFMIEPHWVIMSTLGFAMYFSILVNGYRQKLGYILNQGVIVVLLSSYILGSMWYTLLYRDEKTYVRYWLSQVPSYKNAMFCLAHAYQSEGNFDAARNLYTRSLDKKVTDWQTYANLGLMDYLKRDYAKALENYGYAIQMKEDVPIVYNNIGLVYLAEMRFPEAKRSFLRALDIYPYLLEPRLNLAKISLSEGRFKDAESYYEDNLKIDPSDINTLRELVSFYLSRGNPLDAAETGKKLLKYSNNAADLTGMGSLFAQNNYTQIAQDFYLKALKLDRRFVSAYLELGKLYGNLEQFDAAITIWQEGTKIDPEEKQFLSLIRIAEQLKGKSQK